VLATPWKGKAGEILDACAAHGLLLLQAGPDVLRFVPPLTITDAELAEGIERLGAALREVVGGQSDNSDPVSPADSGQAHAKAS